MTQNSSPKPKTNPPAAEHSFRLLFENHPIPMWIYDLKTLAFLDVNDAALEKYGYTRDEFLARTIKDIRPTEDVENLIDHLEQKRPTLEHSDQWRHRLKNGRVINVEITSHILEFEGHKAALVMAQDITERKQAEKQLRKLTRTVEQSPASIVITDVLGNIEYVNPKFSEVTGYSMQEVLSKTPNILKSGHTTREEYKILWNTITSGNIWKGEFLDKKKNGETYWEFATIAPVFDDNGKITNYLAVKEDITERKQAEEMLGEFSQRLKLAIASGQFGVWDWNVKENVMIWDDRMFELYGVTRDAFPSNIDAWTNGLHPDDSQRAIDECNSALNGEKEFNTIFRILQPGGAVKQLKADGIVIRDSDGKALRMIGINADITERKRAEEALREREEQYRTLVEQLPAIIYIDDTKVEGRTAYVSPQIQTILGFTPQEWQAESPDLWSKQLHPDDLERAHAGYMRCFLYGEAFDAEYRIHASDGRLLWFRDQAVMLPNKNGKPHLIHGVISDITERKQAEIEIKERTEELELINALNEAVNRGDSLDKTMEVFAKELRQISICKYSTIYLISPDGKNIVMQHLGLSAGLVKKIEQLIGRPLPQVEIPILEGGYFERALQSEHGIITTDPNEIQGWMLEFTESKSLPAAVRGVTHKLIPQIYKLLDIRSTLILPLISDKKVIGLLDISSSGILTEKDLNRIQKISGQLTSVILREQANKALLESEKRYRLIFDGVQDAIFVESKDGRILGVNNRACEMYGYSHNEFLGKTVKDLVPEGNISFPLPNMQSNASYSSLETINRRANGEQFPIEINGRLQTINGEEVLLVIVRDITERKQTEEALLESEQKYRLLFDEMLSGVAVHEIICDPQGNPIDYRFIAINTAFEKMTGLTSAAVVGKTVLEVMPATESSWIRRYGQVALTRIPTQFESYSSELEKYFEVRAFSPENGKFATVFNDVTQRKQAEVALQESEALYRQAIEVAGAVPYLQSYNDSGADIHFDFIGDGIRQITGYGAEEFNATLWDTLIQETNLLGDLAGYSLEEAIRRVRSGEIPLWKCEYRLRARDGKIHWVFEAAVELYAIDGFAKGSIGTYQDITERKQAEENIHQHVKELELLYESGLAFGQLLNPKEIAQKVIELLGQKMNWHHTALRLIRPQDNSLELMAFDQPGLGSPVEQQKIQARLSKSITRAGEGLSGWAIQQSKIIRSDDVASDPHYVASYPGIHSGLYIPLKSADHILGVISIESEQPNAFSETDERLIATLANQAANAFQNAHLYEEINRYAEGLEQGVQERTAEIESTRRRLELAMKTAGIGIWELDIKQDKDYWDDKLFSLYGLSKETAQPSPQTWHNIIHPDDLAHQLDLMEEALHNNQPYDTEFRVIWPDASIHYIKSTGVVIRDADGLPERMIGANQDITLQKQAEESLNLANIEMERGLRMKNEFLANMSHELRTPLNAILGISESLEERISGELNEKQLKYVRIISESGHHLLDLINDILDLSKIEAGKLELNVQTISVEKLCISSLRMIKELAQKKLLNVLYQVDENVKYILGDERRLKQSLVNLLGNAVKFTPPGKAIGLEVNGNTKTNEVIFTVWDQGIGIDPQDIKHLFKPFVQLNAGLAREYGGTGLGLALVAQMIRLHGGRIDLTSELQVGSRFMFTLPWMPTEQKRQLTTKPLVLADSPKSREKRTGKILIVDDTEVIAQLVSEYLRHWGYETLIAHDGREGVLLARQEHPQIILMDVMMPIMSGWEATRQIRADADLKDIPIIGLTALAMASDREQCLAAGMNDHLSKPIEMLELVQIIENYLHQTS